jgi:hypothetical protein
MSIPEGAVVIIKDKVISEGYVPPIHGFHDTGLEMNFTRTKNHHDYMT